jgi:branched-chain amino acid transport system ATP-binding protein
MLELENVHAFYESSHVLFGIDLRLEEGEVVALIGRNGMGKTTTVRAIMAINPARAGTIRLLGRDIHALPTHAIAHAGIGLVPEGRRIFPNLTVRENLVAMASNRHARCDPWTLEKIFEIFPNLAERQAIPGNRLSGGEQQMLAIGRALMTNPRLLILDEATEGLAPRLRQAIWNCLWELRRARESILVIDRNIDALADISDRLYIMEKGTIVWYGSSAEFRTQRGVLSRHLGIGVAATGASPRDRDQGDFA